MKLHEEFKFYENMWDELNVPLDPTNALIAEIEAGAKALLQDSPLAEAIDLDIDNAEIEATQAKADKEWKKSVPWLKRVKVWFSEKVLNLLLKNEKLYDKLVTNALDGRQTETFLMDLINSLQQLHWVQLEEVAIKNATAKGMDTAGLALKVISKDSFYHQEYFFSEVLKLLKFGAVKDIFEAVRALDLELFDYQLVPESSLD